MRSNVLVAFLVFALCLGVVAVRPAPAAAPPDAAAIAKLVEQLGSSDFEEREKATKDLDAIGAPALDVLRKAAESHAEAEVRMRAGNLVKNIEMRTVSSTVLAPRMIHLVYKDTPLPEAVADFTKQTGYVITLHDPENKLKDRKVTLDTGDVPFWVAFDQFCTKAGLIEMDGNRVGPIRRPPIRIQPGVIQPLPVQPVPQQQKQLQPAQKGQVRARQVQVQQAVLAEVQVQQVQVEQAQAQPIQVQAQPIQIQVQPGGIQVQPLPANGPGIGIAPVPVGGNGTIVLTDGTPKALPTDASGPVRIRALDDNSIFGGSQPGEYLIVLQATPEPRLRLVSVSSVVITRAVDDQNQALMQATVEINPNPNPNQPQLQPAIQPVRGPRGIVADAQHQYVPVHLKKGLKPSKSLKELTGVITAEILGEPKAVLSADDILKAAGKTFKGDSGYLKIVEITGGNDQLIIKIEMQQPKDVVPGQPNPALDMVPQPLPPQKIQPGAGRGLQVQPAQQQAQAQVVQPGQPVQGGVAQPALVARPNVGNNGLALLDEKGNALPLIRALTTRSRTDGQGGLIVEQTLTFQTKGMGVPSKLVLAGSRTATVNIPFTLKNVPLP